MEGEALSLLLSSFFAFCSNFKVFKKKFLFLVGTKWSKSRRLIFCSIKKISRGSKNYLVHYIHRDNVCLGKNVPVLRLLEAASRCIEILSYLFHLLGNEHLHTYLNIQYKIIGPLCLDYKWLKGQFFYIRFYTNVSTMLMVVSHTYVCMMLCLYSLFSKPLHRIFSIQKLVLICSKKNGTYYFIRHQFKGILQDLYFF